MKQWYMVVMDQSTAASKAFLIDADGGIARSHAIAHRQAYPQSGHVEQDGTEIWRNVQAVLATVLTDIPPEAVAGIAISNQRETLVVWDRETGEPICPVIVWQDVRAGKYLGPLQAQAQDIFARTGLPLSPYYTAAKALAAFHEYPAVREAASAGRLCLGTVDSYLVYRLTGGTVFRTDVSNASRTQWMNLASLRWDERILTYFGIDARWLPEITPSDGDFGRTHGGVLPDGLPITGVLGDSHAALFGQNCHQAGMAKATYGTGSSVMLNVGEKPVFSQNGLSASVGFGFQGRTCYVLEGNVTCSGDTLSWLRDELDMVQGPEEIEALAGSVPDTGGVYLVPAFSGLGAPVFDEQARALLCGMNRSTRKAHVVRAALESIAYQDADVIRAMEAETGRQLQTLRVDGAPTRNHLLMQLQADLLNCPVQCAAFSELSALGVGYLGGIAAGLYGSMEDIPAARQPGRRFEPSMDPAERAARLSGWALSVRRARING